jgi:hypothetical protein
VDLFKPREYQEDLIKAMLANIMDGEKLTIGLAAPGYGKQNAGIYAAVTLARECNVPLSIHFVPRVNLAGQYEIGWEGPWHRNKTGKRVSRDRSQALMMSFDEPRLNHLTHRPNADPLVPEDWKPPYGIVACYASLVKDMSRGEDGSLFLALARRFEGKFLLHIDEAQFCGAAEFGEGDAITGGVQAGAYAEILHRYSFHTLLQTGTENRADGEELALCGDRYAQPGPGEIRGPLIPNAEGTYGRAREKGYLREFEADLIDDHVVLESLNGTEREEYKLSKSPRYLAKILSRDKVWQALCDKVVQRLNERQKVWGGYKGLICCLNQEHARNVLSYIKIRHPGVRILLAVSSENEALTNLKAFRKRDLQEDGTHRESSFDLLITVRMAFIGYDCKNISVVGILTNYRDKGHLYQQVGRGLRVFLDRPYGEQVCWLIVPNDPQMRRFLEWLKNERKRGIKGGGVCGDIGEAKMYVKDAYPTTTTANGLGGTVDNPAEYDEIERLRHELGIYEPVTKLKRLKDIWTGTVASKQLTLDSDDSGSSENPDLTEKQIISELNSDVLKLGKRILSSAGITPGEGRYADAINWFYSKVADLSYYSGDVRTPEQASARLEAAEIVETMARERGGIGW